MNDDDVKICVYHELTPLEILECRQWARDNFEYFDGETSPLWNNIVQQEFARMNKRRAEKAEMWQKSFQYIAADIRLMENKEMSFLELMDSIK